MPTPAYIDLSLQANSKEAAILKLAKGMVQAGVIHDAETYVSDVLSREATLSTYCGYGIAIPHAASKAVVNPGFAFARTSDLVWDEDDEKVRFILALAIPVANEGGDNNHIELMSQIATLALEEEVRAVWERAQTHQEILESFVNH
jgi:mannitol/fructose-specific phosphotransferase system IIA component (Ntr-type)